MIIPISGCNFSGLLNFNNVLSRSSIFSSQSSIGFLDIIEHKWLCVVKYYILIE
jgi:hypothetical protein